MREWQFFFGEMVQVSGMLPQLRERVSLSVFIASRKDDFMQVDFSEGQSH